MREQVCKEHLPGRFIVSFDSVSDKDPGVFLRFPGRFVVGIVQNQAPRCAT
jgi:hypothetical protein